MFVEIFLSKGNPMMAWSGFNQSIWNTYTFGWLIYKYREKRGEFENFRTAIPNICAGLDQ